MAASSSAAPAITNDTIIQTLSRASTTVVSTFNQRGANIAPYKNGFCRGACLDWIRRVLNDGRPDFKTDEAHKIRRFTEMASTQGLIDPAFAVEVGRHKEMQAAFLKEKAAYTTEQARLNEQDSLWGSLSREQKNQHNLDMERSNNTGIRLTRESKELNARDDLDSYSTLWPTFISEWNKKNASRQSGSKLKPHKRTFDSIAVLPTPKDTTPVAGLKPDAIGKLMLELDFFKAEYGRCIMLNFSYGSDTEAHAVAVERLLPTSFRLFDPNYGVYEFASAAKLATAVGFLFGEAYPAQGNRATKLQIAVFNRKS